MKLMDRYLLREYLVPVIYCFVGFSLVYTLLDLFGHLAHFLKARTPLVMILQYYVFWLLPFLEYLLPASLLFATLYTLWRLTRNNELTAMRVSGFSLWRIMYPFLGVGLLASLTVLAVKELAVPRCNPKVAYMRSTGYSASNLDSTRSTPAYYKNPNTRQFWQIARFDPYRPNRLHGVKITEDRSDGTKAREIAADRAEWLDGAWWFFGARVQTYLPDGIQTPKGPAVLLPGAGVELPFLKTRPSDIANEVKPWADLSSLDMWRYLGIHTDLSHALQASLAADLHYRLAIPWACLIVTLFAIPTGARNARQGMLVAIFIAVACFFSFFTLLQVGVYLAKKQILSPWLGAWLSNIVFLGAGLGMTRRLR
jgi:LPS export ABC transporter permease LptG